MARVILVCGLVLVLSCCGGQRELRCAYASDDLGVFLEGYRRAAVGDDEKLILAKYIDPSYRREQLEELLEGNQGQFFDELFGLGKDRFADIVEMEYACGDIHFEGLEYGPCPDAQGAQCPVVLTYENEVRVEDCVYLIKYPDGERAFAVEGPRG
jgi:hypothetical protein